MKDDARLQAALELLEDISAADGRAADGTAAAFFRMRRFIGSKDRHAISMRVWGVLRHWARLAWWFREAVAHTGAHGNRPDWDAIRPRARLVAYLTLVEERGLNGVESLCTGEKYAPRLLNDPEKAVVRFLHHKPLHHAAMPLWVRSEVPEWIVAPLQEIFADRLPDLLRALTAEAPVDVRVNTLKADRANAMLALAGGTPPVDSSLCPYAPLALRLNGRTNLAAHDAFREGLVEVQDEGSQLVALLTDARPEMAVVDFCAGAGGKTLALAAQMENKGRLVACDVLQGRIERSAVRLKRAGVHNVTRRILSSESDKWVKRSKGTFDRVLIDAPCSGTGTWRRNPDARWRLSAATLRTLADLQGRILRSASRLVKPGGRVIYATCSLLEEENERQIDLFLKDNADSFQLMPIQQVWTEVVASPCPVATPMLRLDPATHGTDGFFVAVLHRRTDGFGAESIPGPQIANRRW